MKNEIVDILNEKGPLVSNDIINDLELLGITRNNAKQKIHRAVKKNEIIVFEGFNLTHNRKLYLLEKHLTKKKKYNFGEIKVSHYDQIIKSLSENDTIFSTLFTALREKNFLILEDAYKILPIPIVKFEKTDRRTFIEIFNPLKKLGILTSSIQCDKKFIHEYKTFNYDILAVQKRANQINQEQLLIKNIVKIFEKKTLIGWNSSIFFSDDNKINYYGYYFDSIATTYVFNLKKEEHNGAKVLFTFSFDKTKTSIEVEALLIKIQNISKKNKNIVPVFIYKEISKKDFLKLKKIGVITISLNSIFNTKDITDIDLFINLPLNSILQEEKQIGEVTKQLLKSQGCEIIL